MREVYLDHAATTAVSPEVAQLAYTTMTQQYGNPSSLHRKGLEAELAVEQAAKQIAKVLGCPPETLYFTSGGTEANNLAILGGARAKKRRGNKIVTTAWEHSSVLETVQYLEREEGFQGVYLKPNSQGELSVSQILQAVDKDTILVSVMYVNNEVGAILPLEELVTCLRREHPQVYIHCDGVQAFGKLPLSLKKLDLDMLTITGHKIHAPKGIGAIYLKKGVRVLPLLHGGEQQNRIRPGTESVPLIAAFGLAAQQAQEKRVAAEEAVTQLSRYFEEKMLSLEGVVSNTPAGATPYIRNISVEGYRSEILLHALEQEQVYVSSGSACAKGAASHVLSAMGLSRGRQDSALRISFDSQNTEEEIDRLYHALKKAMLQVRRIQ